MFINKQIHALIKVPVRTRPKIRPKNGIQEAIYLVKVMF